MESCGAEHPVYSPNMSRREVAAQRNKLFSEKNFVGVMELWKDNIFPEDMTAAEVELEWYKALFEEDCLRIMKLLTIDPTLVKVGWQSESESVPPRIVERSPGSHRNPKESPWRGRTALHVSARRGCIELVKQVLELYDLKIPSTSDRKQSDRQVASSSGDCRGKDKKDPSHDTDKSGKSAGGSSHDTDTGGKRAGNSCDDGAASDPISSHYPTGQRKEVVSCSHDDGTSQRDQEIRGESAERSQKAAGAMEGSLGIIEVEEAVSWPVRRRSVPDNSRLETARQVVAHWREENKANKASKGNRARRAFAGWKRNLGKGADSHRAENAGVFGFPKHDPFPTGLREPVSENQDSNSDTTLIVSSSRKDLLDLLVAKDGKYRIDALAIAIIHFNSDLFNLLVYAIGECGTNPYDIIKRETGSAQDSAGDDRADWDRITLRQTTREVLESLDPAHSKWLLEDYAIHDRDFNVLPAEFLEYFFHYLFTPVRMMEVSGIDMETVRRNCRRLLWEKIRSCADSFWRFVAEFEDRQGRTPAHVAADDSEDWQEYWEIFEGDDQDDVFTHFFTRSDGAGRTPLHRSVTRSSYNGNTYGIKPPVHAFELLWEQHSAKKHISVRNIYALSQSNGFTNKGEDDFAAELIQFGHSPLHACVIRKKWHSNWLRLLIILHKPFHKYILREPFELFNIIPVNMVMLDELQLACLVEDGSRIVGEILKCGYLATLTSFETNTHQVRKLGQRRWAKYPFQALHIIAALGNYEMLKMFLKDRHCDPFVEDTQGNSALHYALREPFDSIQLSLLHYVSCEDLFAHRRRQLTKDILDPIALLERQRCVTLLLHTGCEILKGNKNGEIPNPQGRLTESLTFSSWWSQIQEKEFVAITSNLNTATNAISVTAALVATASYVGPLQPPLSYAPNQNNVNQIQYENVWVATFLFCDTLSFYLAIIAIVLSLIPSLPVPKQPTIQEMQRTRIMMMTAVGVLIPSILCVLVAFASSSMAVVSANIVSSLGGKLAISTASICAPLLMGAFFLFVIRLLYIFSPGTPWIEYLYRRTSYGVQYPRKMDRQALEFRYVNTLVKHASLPTEGVD